MTGPAGCGVFISTGNTDKQKRSLPKSDIQKWVKTDLQDGFYYPVTKDRMIDTTNVSVYPNPSSNLVNIKLSRTENVHIQVLDLCGQVLENKMMNSNHYILNIENYEKGIYLINIDYNNKKITKKIIKL